ncbi:MAG: hypothetical protein JRN20_13615 [Nitrososphaerota archaeon]|nr:hypothetical protein [Nitrososphaerota archaeon]MDG6921715.1 hypothetical protein [Nitrososphaerota archaeon]
MTEPRSDYISSGFDVTNSVATPTDKYLLVTSLKPSRDSEGTSLSPRTNSNSWNVSLPWTWSTNSPGDKAYIYSSPGVSPNCTGKFSLVSGDGDVFCLKSVVTLTMFSDPQASTFNKYNELRPGQTIVSLLGFTTEHMISPQTLRFSCVP